jgi:RNA polymerase sigma-70 factor (ECF subfamily)
MVYCVVPRDLAPLLHDLLRRHFRADRSVEVVVEQRTSERRLASDRRSNGQPAGGEAATGRTDDAADRRVIRAYSGRRLGERRALEVAVAAPVLPRRARSHVDRLVFFERLEPSASEQEDIDTARLLIRIQAGERDLFAFLYTRYFDRVYSYLRIALDDPHEAEDAAQQVFVNVLRALPQYELRRSPFRAWLFTIVRNCALKELGRRARIEPSDPDELTKEWEASAPAGTELSALDWISDRELMMFVERLSLAQRQVLVLRFLLGLTTAEIAAVLGRSQVEVRSIQSRAVRFLRARLEALGRTAPREGRVRMRGCLRQARVLGARRWALHS